MPTIDFTSAYRDATQGSTLKALAARRAEMQAANAAMKPREVKSPWQGAANIADTISGAIREGRLANEEARGRARFAELLAGGLTPDEAGEAYGLDPETTQKWMDRNWAQEDTKAERTYTEGRDKLKNDWDVAAAAARAKEARDLAEQQDKSAAARQDDQQAASLVLADHNATIDQKQAAQKVLDDAKVEETKVKTGRQTSDIDRRAEADIASKKAEQDAAMADPAAKVKLAGQAGYLSPEEEKARIDAINAEAAKKGMSAGLEEQNKKFAVDVLDWKQQGAANIQTQLAQTKNALNLLDSTKQNWLDKPGYVMGVAEQVLPSWAQSVIGLSSSDTIKARDSLRTAVQSSLKAVLGSQYTEREGVQVLERAFSTTMDPAENIRRANLVMDQIKQIAANKQAMVDYYDKNGQNLDGYTGPGLDTSALETLDFGGGAPVFDPSIDKEGDTGSDESGKWVVKGGKWVRQ